MTPKIKNHKGIFLPAHETHLTAWMDGQGLRPGGGPNYQLKKINAVLARVPEDRRRCAVDVGAHCGLWSYHLAKAFEFVHAFEPIELHRECFRLNLPTAENVELYPFALGAEERYVAMHTTNESSGDSWVKGEGDIPMRTMDSFALENVDLIKLDCEGYELFALQGGEETIRRCLPVIIVEQKPHRAEKFQLPDTAAVPWLESIGYTLAQEMSGDFIMTPPTQAKPSLVYHVVDIINEGATVEKNDPDGLLREQAERPSTLKAEDISVVSSGMNPDAGSAVSDSSIESNDLPLS